jgi:hypothetical protein
MSFATQKADYTSAVPPIPIDASRIIERAVCVPQRHIDRGNAFGSSHIPTVSLPKSGNVTSNPAGAASGSKDELPNCRVDKRSMAKRLVPSQATASFGTKHVVLPRDAAPGRQTWSRLRRIRRITRKTGEPQGSGGSNPSPSASLREPQASEDCRVEAVRRRRAHFWESKRWSTARYDSAGQFWIRQKVVSRAAGERRLPRRSR